MLRKLLRAGLIAALYFVLTYFLAPISFGPIQVRISEALVVLPFAFPEAIFGVTVGCLIANFTSPFGLIDVIFGTLLTFIAAVLTWIIGKTTRKKLLAPIPPILLNGFGVAFYVISLAQLSPIELEKVRGLSAAFTYIFTHFSLLPYLGGAFVIGLGEALATYLLGIPLLSAVERRIKQ